MSDPSKYFTAALRHCWSRAKDRFGKQETLAREIGTTQSTVSEALRGKKVPSVELQARFARVFGYDDLMDFLVLGKRLLAQESGERPRDPLEALAGPTRPVPIFDANCGDNGVIWTDGGMPVGESLDTIDLPLAWLNDNSFCLKVHNDSMEPTLLEGDVVLVNPHVSVENGDIVFVRMPDGEKLIKRYRRPEGQEVVILESDNRRYPPIVLTPDNGEGAKIYKVVKLVERML